MDEAATDARALDSAYLGIDLAWGSRARTGLAMLDGDGRLVASTSVVTDDEIAAFVATHAPGHVVAAIDAPLVVPNATGHRVAERDLGAVFRAYNAGAHAANRSIAWLDPPRAEKLAGRFGWSVDPSSDGSVAIEVYPHPAMVALFGLGSVIPYKAKRGRDVGMRRSAFEELVGHLERVCESPLRLSSSSRWFALKEKVATAQRQVDLERIEDELDAILCAYLAWLWATDRSGMRLFGSLAEGYIVVPDRLLAPPSRRTVNPPDLAGLFRAEVPHLTADEAERLARVARSDR